jgi:formyltetrahydrofolate deformylase
MNVVGGREYVLTLSCPDKPGIVYAVSSFLVQHSANILASQQYGESPDGRFFMRVHFSVPPRSPAPPGQSLAELERGFSWVAEAFHMTWQLHDQVPSRITRPTRAASSWSARPRTT